MPKWPSALQTHALTHGGAAFYNEALAMGPMQIDADQHLADQIDSCTVGNPFVCVVQTFQNLADQLGMAAAKKTP